MVREFADWGCAFGCVGERVFKDGGIRVRNLFISAMDYLDRRSEQGKLGEGERNRLAWTLVLGVIMNDFYDQKKFEELDKKRYIEHRRKIPEDLRRDYRQYFRDLRGLEIKRPQVGDGEEKIVKYREKINRVTLAMSFSAANFGNYRELMEGSGDPIFENTLKLIYALQVVDD